MAWRSTYRRPIIWPWLAMIVFIAWSILRLEQIRQAETFSEPEREFVVVERVIDGDTLLLTTGERVRLLGVDTPETKHPTRPQEPFGAEATEFTRGLVEGKQVELIYDVERYDDYERILAFVFIEETFLNELLVSSGLATAQPQYPFRNDFKKRIIAAEKVAQEQQIGVWSSPHEVRAR